MCSDQQICGLAPFSFPFSRHLLSETESGTESEDLSRQTQREKEEPKVRVVWLTLTQCVRHKLRDVRTSSQMNT